MKVTVATYEHRYGTDVRVFEDPSSATAWRAALADEWWEHEFPNDPKPDDCVEEYWDRIDSEFFTITETEVE